MSRPKLNKTVEIRFCDGPKCPHFSCIKKSLRLARRRNGVMVICFLTGDQCIGYRCQFMVCSAHSLAADGRCMLSVKSREEESTFDIIEEVSKFERDITRLESRFKKVNLEKYI